MKGIGSEGIRDERSESEVVSYPEFRGGSNVRCPQHQCFQLTPLLTTRVNGGQWGGEETYGLGERVEGGEVGKWGVSRFEGVEERGERGVEVGYEPGFLSC